MITVVFFDLYGTLAGFRPSRYEIQSEALADFGITVTPDGILRGYYLADAFMSHQNATKPVRSLSREENRVFHLAEYERRVLRGAGVDVSQDEAWEIWRRITEDRLRPCPVSTTRYRRFRHAGRWDSRWG